MLFRSADCGLPSDLRLSAHRMRSRRLLADLRPSVVGKFLCAEAGAYAETPFDSRAAWRTRLHWPASPCPTLRAIHLALWPHSADRIPALPGSLVVTARIDLVTNRLRISCTV